MVPNGMEERIGVIPTGRTRSHVKQAKAQTRMGDRRYCATA